MLPKTTARHFILSSSPHAHAPSSVSGVMLDVILALLPALCCGVYFFGVKALFLVAVCVSACLVTEALCRLAMKRENSLGDLSAVLTGLLLALNLPPDLPLWMAVAGSVFAIGVAKQAFGGLGYNPFNPALAARAFMLVSFTGAMTTWSASGWMISAGGLEAVTHATPLALIKKGAAGFDWSQAALLKDLFFGNVNGCVGETSAFALLAGAAYLLARRVITWHIPVAFLGTMYAFALCHGGAPAIVHVLSGGAVIGACFMATDYVTSPITARGKLIFGCGCGLLTMCIRTASTGAYPEGVSFSILIMNALAPLISRWTQPKPYGAR
ncbi:MAG: RnfABCDGE type electron transport complex subunit D [Kiritimatiellia bacterium]